MIPFMLPLTHTWCYVSWGGVGQRDAAHVKVHAFLRPRQWHRSCHRWKRWNFIGCLCNATTKINGHTVLSPVVSSLVHQWAWRQSIGPLKPLDYLKVLRNLRPSNEKMGQDLKMLVAVHFHVGMKKKQFGPRPPIKRVPTSFRDLGANKQSKATVFLTPVFTYWGLVTMIYSAVLLWIRGQSLFFSGTIDALPPAISNTCASWAQYSSEEAQVEVSPISC